jgi:hypothetical protein
LTLKGATSQTANLIEFQKSDGTVHAYFDADGDLAIVKDGVSPTISLECYGTSLAPTVIGNRAGGTLASPTGAPDGGTLLVLEAYGHDGVSAFHKSGLAAFAATELHSATVGGTQFKIQTMLTGGVSLANRLLIDGLGNVTINALGTQSPTTMQAGLAMKSSTAPTACGVDVVALYEADANAEAGKSWWHAMGEDDVAHQLLGAIFCTSDPSVQHDGSFAIDTTGNTVKIYIEGAWRQLAFWVGGVASATYV